MLVNKSQTAAKSRAINVDQMGGQITSISVPRTAACQGEDVSPNEKSKGGQCWSTQPKIQPSEIQSTHSNSQTENVLPSHV